MPKLMGHRQGGGGWQLDWQLSGKLQTGFRSLRRDKGEKSER